MRNGFPEEISDSGASFVVTALPFVPLDALTHTGLPKEAFLPVSKELPTPAAIEGFLMSRRSVREFKERAHLQRDIGGTAGRGTTGSTASNSQKLHWIVVEGGQRCTHCL